MKKTLQQQADERGISKQAVWLKTPKGRAYEKAYRKTDKYKAYKRAYNKAYLSHKKETNI
jgi:hypothetical protein